MKLHLLTTFVANKFSINILPKIEILKYYAICNGKKIKTKLRDYKLHKYSLNNIFLLITNLLLLYVKAKIFRIQPKECSEIIFISF